MQVSIESLEGLQRKMTVQVPAEQIDTAIDQKLKQLSKTVKLDGFRPGKVPVSVVKQKFGNQVRQEVIGDVAYILWEAKPWFPMATDTFIVRDGKFVMQTFAAYAST